LPTTDRDTEIWFTSHWFYAMMIDKLNMIQKVPYEEVISFQKEKKEIEITINSEGDKNLKSLIQPADRKKIMTILQEKCSKQS